MRANRQPGNPSRACNTSPITGASAIAAGNIFNFKENAYRRAKRQLKKQEFNIRFPYAF